METLQTSLITKALASFDNRSSRSLQSDKGILGPSDIGFCRNKARLTTIQQEQTDHPPKWAAAVGTALHTYIEAALKASYPDWKVGSQDDIRCVATLPNGTAISGTPDIVIPENNTIIDIKTVNGFAWIKRNGPSESNKYQRYLYALGLAQNKDLDGTKPITVGNIYFDRSGKETEPILFTEEIMVFEDPIAKEIEQWVSDVVYAVKNNEEASKDVAPAVCEKICEFFTACRGGLDVNDGQELIRDSSLLDAIDAYLEGREMEKQGKALKSEASARLEGTTGLTSDFQVRWVTVNPSTMKEHQRAGYDRLDIRKKR